MSHRAAPYALDPFGPSANPGAYVACEASERARAALESILDAGRVAAIVGPPGNGKTLLLRLIGGREEERARVAYVPFCTLEEDDFYSVVLNALGAAPRQEDPRTAVLELARSLSARGGIVILVDDAGAMSDACAESLAQLCRESVGAVRVGLAAVEGIDASRVFRAFGDMIDIVRLSDGMNQIEVRRYLESRLAYGGARPELLAAFDEETVEALHRTSQGNPRRLNHAAEDIVRRATPGATPRLRELTRIEEPVTSEPLPPPASPPTPPVASPPATERSSHLTVVADPKRKRAPIEVPAPLVVPPPRPVAPVETSRPAAATSRPPAALPPAAPPTAMDEGTGVLLPHALDEGMGEYRLVGGQFVEPATGRPPARPIVEPLEVPERAAPSARGSALAQRTEDLRRRASEKPTPRGRELPIRTLGLFGFLIGVVVALYWMPESTTPPAIRPDPPTAAPEVAGSTPSEATAAAPVTPTQAPKPTPVAEPAAVAVTPSVPPAPTPTPPATTPRATSAATGAPVRVSINATPWAVIEVDGRVLGETPLAGVMLSPGVHTFHAIMPDGTTRERAIEIHEGNKTVVFQ